MNLFQVENKDYFLEQVSLFKPPRTQKDKDRVISKENLAGTDTIIATRIRPLLEHETTKGHVVGVVARGVDNCADVHELRKKVNGRPALTVRQHHCAEFYEIKLSMTIRQQAFNLIALMVQTLARMISINTWSSL